MIDVRVEGRVRVSTFSGVLSTEELLAHTRAQIEAPGYDPSLDSLVDMTGLTDLHVTTADVGRVEADFRRATSQHHRRIAFVVATKLAYGYARAYQNQHDDTRDQVEIFEDMASARAWLGLGVQTDQALTERSN